MTQGNTYAVDNEHLCVHLLYTLFICFTTKFEFLFWWDWTISIESPSFSFESSSSCKDTVRLRLSFTPSIGFPRGDNVGYCAYSPFSCGPSFQWNLIIHDMRCGCVRMHSIGVSYVKWMGAIILKPNGPFQPYEHLHSTYSKAGKSIACHIVSIDIAVPVYVCIFVCMDCSMCRFSLAIFRVVVFCGTRKRKQVFNPIHRRRRLRLRHHHHFAFSAYKLERE